MTTLPPSKELETKAALIAKCFHNIGCEDITGMRDVPDARWKLVTLRGTEVYLAKMHLQNAMQTSFDLERVILFNDKICTRNADRDSTEHLLITGCTELSDMLHLHDWINRGLLQHSGLSMPMMQEDLIETLKSAHLLYVCMSDKCVQRYADYCFRRLM